MASQNGHEPAFSVAEVVGISAAAAAALGGVIIALGRTQANSGSTNIAAVEALPSRGQLRKGARRGRKMAAGAAGRASKRYPEARDTAAARFDRTSETARAYGADVAARAEVGLDRAMEQGKVLSDLFQESIIPAVVTGASKARKNVAKQARNTDTDELVKKSRHYADEAAVQLRHAGESVSKALQDDVLPAVAPVVKEASAYAEDLIDQLRDRAGDVKRRNDRFPGAKAVSSGKDSAQHAIQTSSKAATDSLSALVWIALSSALVYLALLSPERREQVKSAAFDAIEQVRLLIGDFKGYETEF